MTTEEAVKMTEARLKCLIIECLDDIGLLKEPCEDAISREAVLHELHVLWNSSGDKDYCMETLRDFVVNSPSVTPVRPKGKWVLLDEESNIWGYTLQRTWKR